MKNFKSYIKIGSILAGFGLLVIIYNFYDMYSVVGKCSPSIPLQSCQAYHSWTALNIVGWAAIGSGLIILASGLVLRRKK